MKPVSGVVTRPPAELDLVSWEVEPPIEYYVPASVPAALRAIRDVDSARSAERAYHACVYGFANNHSGNLYPSAAAAAPFLLWYVVHGSTWSRRAAMNVLDETVWFAGWYDATAIDPASGARVPLADAYRRTIATAAPLFLAMVADATCDEVTRSSALTLLEALELHEPDVMALFTTATPDRWTARERRAWLLQRANPIAVDPRDGVVTVRRGRLAADRPADAAARLEEAVRLTEADRYKEAHTILPALIAARPGDVPLVLFEIALESMCTGPFAHWDRSRSVDPHDGAAADLPRATLIKPRP